MPGSLQRRSIAQLIARAESLGLDVPNRIIDIACGHGQSYPAVAYATAHPDDEHGRTPADVPDGMLGCCVGSAFDGLAGCTCWEPVYDIDQAELQPLTDPAQLQAMPRACSDCAFRRDSPERTDGYTEDVLLALPASGEPFWCHDGMRRPARWRHPAGVEVDGSPDDWRPAMRGSVPYRADGAVASICHGWAVRAARAKASI